MKLSKAEIAWWEAQPDAQICRECGKSGSRAYVQPQFRGGGALCTDCIDRLNREARATRKAQLAAEPRCAVPECTRRGAWKAGGVPWVLLCGAHLGRVKRAHARVMGSAGGLGLFLPAPRYSEETLIRMAREGR